MSTTYYSLYVQKVMALAKTLVIKSDAAAQAMNAALKEIGHTVEDDYPETWRYYLNLAGEYHYTDTEMTVTSLDTLETIVFNKANLQLHRATAKNYRYGSKYYEDLLRRYPRQELLINGILNPVELTTALMAEEGKLLSWDPTLVEPQETNLIEELQGYIRRWLARWSVDAYRFTDELYTTAQLGVLFLNIPQWILNIRLANCHTAYAHSFHIREYLASHNRLDQYMDQLTIKQQLFLYRNILYIERNAGKQQTFDWLVEHLLTERDIPLAQYVMRHNLAEMPDALYPEVEFKRSAVNRHYSPGIVETRDLLTVLEEENPLARSNPDVIDAAFNDTQDRFLNSLYTQIPTKILDSSITDMTDSGAFTLSDFLLNHWLHWSTTDRYTSVVTVTHPKTGEYFQVPVRDAFVLYLYCYNASMGQDLVSIPRIMAKEVRKPKIPHWDELWALVERKYINSGQIEAALDDHLRLTNYISVDAFEKAVGTVFDRAVLHRELYAIQEHQHTRGQLQAVVDHFYQDVTCDLVHGDEPTLYEAWCDLKGYDVLELTRLEHGLLAYALVEAATGVSLSGRNSLKEMQAAMLRLMGQLSSYTIQFVQNINSGPILVADDPTQRLGDEWVHARGGWSANLVGPELLDIHGQFRDLWNIDTDSLTDLRLRMRLRHTESMDPTVDYGLRGRATTYARTEGIQVGISFVDPEPDYWDIVIV